MVTPTPSSWSVRGATFAVWLLAAASCAYWGLRLSAPAATGPAAPVAGRAAPPIDPAAVARLLGGAPQAAANVPAPPALSSRFTLLGVAAGTRSREGTAVIAVDGKPPKAFRVGAVVDEGQNLVVQAVQGRQAVLGAPGGPATLTLEMPPAKGVAGGAAGAAPPMMAPPIAPPIAPALPGAPGAAGAPGATPE